MAKDDGRVRKPIKEDPELQFIDIMLRSMGGRPPQHEGSHVSDSIIESEARGQREMVGSEVLPTRCNGGSDEELKAMGIELGEPCEDDALFRPAELPEGWKRKPTDHNMWSKIVDAKGRERLSIFYKAAFYDRDAFINTIARYTYVSGVSFRGMQPGYEYSDEQLDGDRDLVVIDRGTVPPSEVQRFEVVLPPKQMREMDSPPEVHAQWDAHFASEKEAREKALAWLEEHHPDWRNAAAYWD